ncbi:hypothetical protein CCACVL1_10358 [Corchorus capsularis]|uniref:Uncharacterized protein n=1 Tax=Corchorus capsularis TaxID=210143 RepID=A0A1R3IRI0_COCAP|nr:hypothetical protein CCACVL1_10358 [Corchorus capsularis]
MSGQSPTTKEKMHVAKQIEGIRGSTPTTHLRWFRHHVLFLSLTLQFASQSS